jgi:hypothetical protein
VSRTALKHDRTLGEDQTGFLSRSIMVENYVPRERC